MDILVGILDQLQINNTIWIQLACFLITFLFVYNLIFKPYYNAYEQRLQKTEGNQDLAVKITQESEDIYSQYQVEARDLNRDIKGIFDFSRTEAVKESDRLVNEAKQKAQEQVESAGRNIHGQIEKEKVNLQKDIPEISNLIRAKLLGKEMVN